MCFCYQVNLYGKSNENADCLFSIPKPVITDQGNWECDSNKELLIFSDGKLVRSRPISHLKHEDQENTKFILMLSFSRSDKEYKMHVTLTAFPILLWTLQSPLFLVTTPRGRQDRGLLYRWKVGEQGRNWTQDSGLPTRLVWSSGVSCL